MPVASGTIIGPYEILSTLGAGGMGEVYRARDSRLNRDVAIKILPASFSNDPDRLRRFEGEARAVAALSHPNILAIFDTGSYENSPYLVSELLEGQTLRERIANGALPSRKAVEYSLQAAHGLAAAHEKGIVHRDLKPDNLFLTKDGRVKILDFGLAKLTRPEASPVSGTHTIAGVDSNLTSPGMVIGTLGYIAPEQVRGQPADHRSDIFSFGAILYEMLSGQRAFKHDSAPETLTAILKEDPPDLTRLDQKISPGLERIVRHCLEKNPEERFQSARDLAFGLDSLSNLSGLSTPALEIAPRKRYQVLVPWILPLLALLIVLSTGFLKWNRAEATQPLYHQLTFRRGNLHMARFAPDGQTVVYGAAWEGNPIEIFTTRPESPESRSLGLNRAEILGISPGGEMALLLNSRPAGTWTNSGTLARAPLAGMAPREILENVQGAEWDPKGANLVAIRDIMGRNRLEYPIGKVLYETGGWTSYPRVSARGDLIAFLDHPLQGDDGGSVAVVDLSGMKKKISSNWGSMEGLAWSPTGDEIWFTANKAGGDRALYAVMLSSGQERLVARVPGALVIQDIWRDGRVLMTRNNERRGMIGLSAGESKDRDLSWLDWSRPAGISADGKTVLFSEEGEGGGASYSVCIRKMDGTPATRLGEGTGLALSPDGAWVLATRADSVGQLTLLPTKAGEARILSQDLLNHIRAIWFPDGSRFIFSGNEPGRGVRLYVQGVDGKKPQPITPEGTNAFSFSLSQDGKTVAAVGPDQKGYLFPIEGGQPRLIPALAADELPISWSADGRALLIYRLGELPAKVYRLELSNGQKSVLKELLPADSAGINVIGPIFVTPDGKNFIYGYIRSLSDLYLVEGLK